MDITKKLKYERINKLLGLYIKEQIVNDVGIYPVGYLIPGKPSNITFNGQLHILDTTFDLDEEGKLRAIHVRPQIPSKVMPPLNIKLTEDIREYWSMLQDTLIELETEDNDNDHI